MSIANDLKNTQDPIQILNQLIKLLTPKEDAVIRRRFGFDSQEIETLAKIGQDFKVTRERIRQIQAYGFKKLQRNAQKTNLTALRDWALNLMKESGDIINETTFDNQLRIKYPEYEDMIQELKLSTMLFTEIHYESNKIHFRPHFRKNNISLSEIKNISKIARQILNTEKDVLSHNKMVSMIQEALRKSETNLRKKLILAALKLDRRITVKAATVSLTKWRHVNPKTLYDKILFILRKEKEPIHFTNITNKIIASDFDKKSVSQQAVHNELINKSDFILVGRGIYALKEWGFQSGTVCEVITRIIQEQGPLDYEALIDKVLEHRQVKPITVQININNKELFKRDKDNKVRLTKLS